MKVEISILPDGYLSARIDGGVVWHSDNISAALRMPCHCGDCNCCLIRKAVIDKYGKRVIHAKHGAKVI